MRFILAFLPSRMSFRPRLKLKGFQVCMCVSLFSYQCSLQSALLFFFCFAALVWNSLFNISNRIGCVNRKNHFFEKIFSWPIFLYFSGISASGTASFLFFRKKKGKKKAAPCCTSSSMEPGITLPTENQLRSCSEITYTDCAGFSFESIRGKSRA